MITFHVQPVKVMGSSLVATGEEPVFVALPQFIGMVAPTGSPTGRNLLSSSKVKAGSYVGYTVAKILHQEGVRCSDWTSKEEMNRFFREARRLGRKLDSDIGDHPLVSFLLVRNDLGSDISWCLKDDPTLPERIVKIWRVNDIVRRGMGISEARG